MSEEESHAEGSTQGQHLLSLALIVLCSVTGQERFLQRARDYFRSCRSITQPSFVA